MLISKFKNIKKLNTKNILKSFTNKSNKNFSTITSNESCIKENVSKNLEDVKDKINIKIEKHENNFLKKSNVLFFDFQSTTPIDPRVFDAMFPHMTYLYGNPHSKSHEYGWNAEDAVEISRKVIII